MQEIAILGLSKYILYIAFVLLSCSNLSEYDKTQIEEALNDSLLATTQSTNIRTEFLEDGYLKILILANESESYNEFGINETRLNGSVSITVFDSTGSITTTAFSNRATYTTESSIFELYDDVVVYTIGDRKLSSEYLKWDRNTDKISTPEFIILVSPSDSLSGRGFEGLTDLSEYTIRDNGSNAGGRVIIDN